MSSPLGAPLKSLSPTARFMIDTARLSLGTVDERAVRSAAGEGVDWKLFQDLASHHRLEPVLHNALEGELEALLPGDTGAWLKARREQNVFASMRLTSAAIRLSRAFDERDVRMLFIKGLSIEQWLYGQTGIRASGDIDLFIAPSDLAQAVDAMRACDYDLALLPKRFQPGTRLAKQHQRVIKDFVFYRKSAPVVVEMHWRLSRLSSAFPLTFEEAWRERCGFELGGRTFYTLSNESHAVYLCYHGAKHFFARFFWLYDIAKLMQRQDFDWGLATAQAKRLNAEASLAVALVLATEIFHVPLPLLGADQRKLLGIGSRLASGIAESILADHPSLPRPAGQDASLGYAREKMRWNSQLHPSGLHGYAQWAHGLFSPDYEDWESLELPDMLTPLYRLWRPLRLAGKLLKR